MWLDFIRNNYLSSEIDFNLFITTVFFTAFSLGILKVIWERKRILRKKVSSEAKAASFIITNIGQEWICTGSNAGFGAILDGPGKDIQRPYYGHARSHGHEPEHNDICANAPL